MRFDTPKLRLAGSWASALTVWLLLLLGQGSWLQAASLSVSFGSEYLQVGQGAPMSLTFEGVSVDSPPEVPQVENAQIYSQNSRSMQWTQSSTGANTIQTTFTYLVMPLKAGSITVPAITVNISGQQLTSKPVTIKVLTPDQIGDAQAEALKSLAWIRIELPKKEAYLGEVIPAQIQVYAKSAENLQLHQFKAEGFTLGRATHTTQGRFVTNNMPYHVITFHMPIAARKIGRLPVGPAECTLNVQVPTDPRERDPFGRLSLLGGYQMKPLRITSQIEELNILPLPTNNVPSHFSGAVGSFSMNVTAGPTNNLAAGDPITFRVEIQARGTLDDLGLPEQEGWREFKTYPATSQILQKDPLGMSGSKLFEQIVVPEHAEIKELPPFYFSYFDPERRRYETLVQPSIPLSIAPNTAPAAQPNFAQGGMMQQQQKEPEKPREDIAHIEPRLGTLVAGGGAFILRPWFYLLQGLPFLTWLAAIVWQRRQKALARDPRQVRRKQVEQLVQSGLQELRTLAGKGDTEAFYETTLRLLRERLGERLDLPAISITEEVVDDRLQTRGVGNEDIRRLHELFQTCNHARYAGEQSAADFDHSLAELEALLSILKDIPNA